jgi:hypothetical protein
MMWERRRIRWNSYDDVRVLIEYYDVGGALDGVNDHVDDNGLNEDVDYVQPHVLFPFPSRSKRQLWSVCHTQWSYDLAAPGVGSDGVAMRQAGVESQHSKSSVDCRHEECCQYSSEPVAMSHFQFEN